MQKYSLFHKYHDIDELYKKISGFLDNSEISSLNIYSYKINSLWQAFRSYFEVRLAAGGLIIKNDELLFIKRRGKWDIPKGHLSGKESILECARREIKEETGLTPGKNIHSLKTTYHIYQLNEKWILKETHWYAFDFSGQGNIIPQEAESITEVRWFGMNELNHIHRNTWTSISDVIHDAVIKLHDH